MSSVFKGVHRGYKRKWKNLSAVCLIYFQLNMVKMRTFIYHIKKDKKACLYTKMYRHNNKMGSDNTIQ